MKYIILVFIFVLSFCNIVIAQHNHDMEVDNRPMPPKVRVDKHEHKDHEEHDDHDEEEEHEGHDDHDHGNKKAMGKGKAIEEVDESKGLKLGPEAIKSLKLILRSISESPLSIAKETLVTSKDLKGIYRYRDGFFKFIPVKIESENKGQLVIASEELKFGDQIVINALGLLRVADVYSTDKSEYGHSH